MCVFVCARRVHVRVKLSRLPAEGVCEMIGGARIWSGSTGRSRAKAFTYCSLSFFLLHHPVFLFACRNDFMSPSRLLAHFSRSVASFSFTVHKSLSFLFPPLLSPDTSFHLPPSPRVVASDNVICISVVFSWSVKLWNPLIETDYERTFLGFSLLEVCRGYVQLGTLSSPGKKEWNNWWCVIVPALVALIQRPRAFLTFGALNHK